MAGGLIQLITTGIQDAPLTLNPQITFFKNVYKQYTNFAIQQYIKNLGSKSFDTFNTHKIENTGDLLQALYYIIKIPKFSLKKKIKTNNITSNYEINQLMINYNNMDCLIFNYVNYYLVIPNYLYKLYNSNITSKFLNNYDILSSLLPNIITIKDLPNSFKYLNLNENAINPIITLLKKNINFFENYWFDSILNNNFIFNNQLITQRSYINNLYNQITNSLFVNYNYFNNNRNNKLYYYFTEIPQYIKYQQYDINYIIQDNFDSDIIYNYCIINKLTDYKTYQLNSLLYNASFITTLFYQLYPKKFNTFTFWKKIGLLLNNEPNLNYSISTNNSFDEWSNLFDINFASFPSNIKLQLYITYKKFYSITQNKIIQSFNTLSINNPDKLFIILSTFINYWDNLIEIINFDDYNSNSNTNLLNDQINIQLNNYSILEKNNSNIIQNNISKNLTIYPVDLMILYPYIAYKLVEKIITSLYFDNYMFLIYWRNKITNFYFMNYKQFETNNIQNTNLYDAFSLDRNLTFYTNLDVNKLLFLKQIKTYFLDIFYSSSFCGCINQNNTDFANFKSTLNTISLTTLNNNNIPISLNEIAIKPYSNIFIKTTYNITNFKQTINQIIIYNWNNNWKDTTKYYIYTNNIQHSIDNFSCNNFTLILNFSEIDIPNIIDFFILEERHYIDAPLINFNSINNPTNDFNKFNIFYKNNNIILTDNIISDTIFNVFEINIIVTNKINKYFNNFKILNIITNDDQSFRYVVNIENNNNTYLITSSTNKQFNKKDIKSIDLEFIYIAYQDLGTKNSNTIVNNRFTIINSMWQYNSNYTYWLTSDNQYYLLKYDNGEFIVFDDLDDNVNYIIKEINNDNLPSLFNYVNFYDNLSKPSDLMDFFLQTTFIMLINTIVEAPYIYVYNLPFIINNNSDIYLNNYKINIILPLNTNQFFSNKVSPLFSLDALKTRVIFNDIVKEMDTLFDDAYNNIDYKNILDVLEESNTNIINLNINYLNDHTNFGKTTLEIINNSAIINNYNLLDFKNNDYNKFNNLAIDIYGNNPTLVSNIKGINAYIYNIPCLSYLANRKINNDLLDYLTNIPKFFQEHISYINNNEDYLLLSNKNQYIETYSSKLDIKQNINMIFFDSNSYNFNTLFTIEKSNLESIYFNNTKLNTNLINDSNFEGDYIPNILNYDNNYDIDIIEINNEVLNYNKFNNFGSIYLDDNINFNSNIDFINYNYILLDDNKIYPLANNLNPLANNLNTIILNKINKNSYLYNIENTNDFIIFSYYMNLYYYKVQLEISNNDTLAELGNCLYYNQKIYYFDIDDYDTNIIKILSKDIFDINIKDYLIGHITASTLDSIINVNFNLFSSFNSISINKITILELSTVNYFNNSLIISNNFIIDNTFQPNIIKINNLFNFIYINDTVDTININLINYNFKKLPPFKLDINLKFKFFSKQTDFEKFKNNSLLKLDNYILSYVELNNNLLQSNNYDLYILPNILDNTIKLIKFNINGSLIVNENTVTINFETISGLINNSYYLINDRYIYLDLIYNEIKIIDTNINYYNIGNFLTIYLLDNLYFENKLPLIKDYLNLNLIDNFLENSIICNEPIKLDYNINSLTNFDSINIESFDNSLIKLLGNDEIKVEIALQTDNIYFVRPIILKNKKVDLLYPFIEFINNDIISDSFIILDYIPIINESFVTINISLSDPIYSIISVNPNISIFSTNNFKVNSISFNDTLNLEMNKYYLWKIIINDTFPIYFWTYFTTLQITYTTNRIAEPIYINNNSLTLFSLSLNTNLIKSLPNIIINENQILKLSNLYFSEQPRILSSKYYINNFYNNFYKFDFINYNYSPCKKIDPKLQVLNPLDILSFDNNYVYIASDKINIITNAEYLIIINNNNYFYIKNINFINNGIFISGLLDIQFDIIVYYSLHTINFNNNNLILYLNNENEYKIINYQYNDLNMNEIILINEVLFLVSGLNTITNYYDLILLSNVNNINCNQNFTGYYSLGNLDNFELIDLPKIDIDPLIYSLDSSYLNFGDFFLANYILQIKIDNTITNDIFYFNKKGTFIKILIYNENYYYFDICDNLQILDILIFDTIIFKIKFIKNHQIYFYNNENIANGFYDFYLPFQPFIINTINVDSTGLITNHSFLNTSFIEIDDVYYNILDNNIINLPNNYYDTSILCRILEINNNKFNFYNELSIDNLTKNIIINSDTCIKINSIILDATFIDLNTNIIFTNYLYYLQPIKINSTINFIKAVSYRDTTTIIEILNPINMTGKTKIYFTPLQIYQNNYYSILQVENFKIPIINSSDYTGYNIINDKLINIFDYSGNNFINFKDNYLPTNNNYFINSFRLVLEITDKNEVYNHLIKIYYPRKIKFYTSVINKKSKFYLDKIYLIDINWILGFFKFNTITFYKNKLLLYENKNEINIWYMYSIQTVGLPFFENNKFKIEVNNCSDYYTYPIYLDKYNNISYNIIVENNKYYLSSDTYLGNNINNIYIKKINYIKNYNQIDMQWKSNYTNHTDSTLLTLVNKSELFSEKNIIPVIIEFISAGDFYKYKIVSLNNDIVYINKNYKWFIDDPYLEIKESYVINNISYIFTKSSINKTVTQLFMFKYENIILFDKLQINKTVPEIINKIKNDTNIKSYMFLNSLKSWSNWSILSFYQNTKINTLLNKGNILYLNNTISLTDTDLDIYWTYEEYNYLSQLLLFLNMDSIEFDKIQIQINIFNDLLSQIELWLNDYSFWTNPIDRINLFLLDYGYSNVIFHETCLVFDDEVPDDNKYFVKVNQISKRKYVLSNQYILDNNKITRNMEQIAIEITNLYNQAPINSYYGIELNDFLYNLIILSNQYKIINNTITVTDEKEYYFLNFLKLYINNLYNSYKIELKMINNNFNEIFKINNNITLINKSITYYYYFNNNFEYIKSNILPNEEVLITKIDVFEDNFYDIYAIDYTIDSGSIYPYYITLGETDIVLPDKIYKINFQNLEIIEISDKILYQSEIDFYLKNTFDSNIDFTLIGISNYNITSTYLGVLYIIQINIPINIELIQTINYKNTYLILYNYDLTNLKLISDIPIETNNILEFSYNIGIKNQTNNILEFYQNNFNYIENQTYIKVGTTLINLRKDIDNNYYIDKEIILSERIIIVNLVYIISVYTSNLYMNECILDTPFKYYTFYINNNTNIIPTNFLFNNKVVPNEIKIINETKFYILLNTIELLTTMQHFINIGETPPVQINIITKLEKYLYKTNEYINLIPNSIIYLYDTSTEEICDISYLNQTKLKFIINSNYSNDELKDKLIRVENIWNISNYILNPNNNTLSFEFPLNLDFKNTFDYKYYIDNNLIDTFKIQVNKTNIIIIITFEIYTSFEFKQIYFSNTIIYKPDLNQIALLNINTDYQFMINSNLYINGYNNLGESIGKYLYNIIVSDTIIFNGTIILFSNTEIYVKLFYIINNNSIIIGCDEQLDITKIYKLNINNIIYNIDNISFYQELYQNLLFYNQINLRNLYVFINNNSYNFNFINQTSATAYYLSEKNQNIKLVNLLQNSLIIQSESMKIKINNTESTKYILEPPIFKDISYWFKSINLVLGEQLLESITTDTININYHLYFPAEKKRQFEKLTKIIEMKTHWQVILPLDFWFGYKSTLAIPLISIPYIDLFLNYQVNKLENILLNDLTNVSFTNNPEMKIELCADCILLDTQERYLFGSTQHEYIIERFKIYSSQLIYQPYQEVPLYFSNLVKDIIFISQPIYNNDATYYNKVAMERDSKYLYWTNLINLYEIYKINKIFTDEIPISYSLDFALLDNIEKEQLMNKSIRITKIKNNKLLNKYELNYILYLMDKFSPGQQLIFQINRISIYFLNIYKNNKKILPISPITSLSLKSNGTDLVPNFSSEYFNIVIPFHKFKSSIPTGYYVYSFSLNPLDQQPSGHLNFSQLDNISLNLHSSDQVVEEPYNLKIIVKEYQILRLMSGLGALAWNN